MYYFGLRYFRFFKLLFLLGHCAAIFNLCQPHYSAPFSNNLAIPIMLPSEQPKFVEKSS